MVKLDLKCEYLYDIEKESDVEKLDLIKGGQSTKCYELTFFDSNIRL